jgi:hypothetical protein
MYACAHEIGGGFFDGVCTSSNATAIFRDLPPQHGRTGALTMGLRPQVDHTPRYRGRRFGLG